MEDIKMKTILKVLCILLLFTGCKKTTVSTNVNRDGSCTRIQTIKSQEEKFLKEEYYFPIDSTWVTETKKDTSNESGDEYSFIAKKEFVSVNDINWEYQNIPHMFEVTERTVKLKKKFRWFYTYLEYTETFGKIMQGPPINDFLNAEQLSVLMEEDSENVDSLEKIFEEWMEHCIIQEFMYTLKKCANNAGFSSLETEALKLPKDSILMKAFEDSLEETNNIKRMLEIATHVFKNDKISSLESDNLWLIFNKKVELMESLFIDELFCQVELPGLIMNTNAEELHGNKASWEIRIDRILSEDYILLLESRVINRWAYYVSGLIVLLAIVLLAIKH